MSVLRANILFVAANLVHTADHQRQGVEGLSWEILAGGSIVTIAAVASLVLAWRRHRHAAVFASGLGLSAAAGIAASHLAPRWSALSDSYPQIHADAISWLAVLLEIGAALLLTAVGLRELRRASSRPTSAPVPGAARRSTP